MLTLVITFNGRTLKFLKTDAIDILSIIKKMSFHLLLLILIGYLQFRQTNKFLIVPSESINIKQFVNCNNTNNYWVPLEYVIKPHSNSRLLIKSDIIKEYNLIANVIYYINLIKYFKTELCSVTIVNDNNYTIMFEHKYRYVSFIKYLIHIGLKADECCVSYY